jgi:hypothetical protein
VRLLCSVGELAVRSRTPVETTRISDCDELFFLETFGFNAKV